MADTNGAAKTARASGSPAASKGKPQAKVVRKKTASGSFVGYILNAVARFFAWYSLYLVLFRCPAALDQCDATSPRICKPYLHVRQAVTPHVQKHFNAYAGPYVQVVKPYYDTVDRAVITPAWTYAVRYGAPQVEQAQAFGHAQWDKNIQPQLAKAHEAALKQYDQVLGPHVEKLSAAVGPYYEIARTNALQTHHDIILPSYEFLAPYAVQGYSAAYAFTTGTVVPGTVWAYGVASEFVDANVVPRLRVIYVESVEPQLEKMGLKISLFDKTPSTSHRTVHTTAPSSFTKPVQASSASTSVKSNSAKTSTTTASTSTSVTATASSADSASSVDAPPIVTEASKLKRPEPVVQDQPEANEDEQRLNARKEVAEDLRMWQEKYAKAADEGAVEIEKRVEEISKRIIRRNARTVGQAHVDQLQEAVAGNLAALRVEINQIVGTLKQEEGSALTPQAAEEQIVGVVRRAGVAIKEKAQAVRTWHQDYDQELRDTVSRAAENHFQILGGIRDLALQKIGMKWAWMEGVTYKDWAKYHLLKNRFEEWESDLEQLIVSHPALEDAQAVAQVMEDEAMEVAASAAHELARLKRSSNVKIELLDDTDEFDEDKMRANAAAAAALAAKLAREAAEAEAAAAAEAEAAAAAAAAEAAAEEETAAAEAVSSEESAAEAVIEGAETVAPEEVSVLLGEATGSVEDVPSSETTMPEEADIDISIVADEEVHLPVDEVVAAEEVPLDVASSDIAATASTETETETETPTASATPVSEEVHDEL